MPQLLIYSSEDELPLIYKCQIRSFIRIFWHDAFQYNLNAPIWPKEWHPTCFVLAEKHAVLSHASVVWRIVKYANITFKVYGLTSIFTYPAFRKKGYGRQVVDTATTYIDESGDADIAILFSDPELEQFYVLSGWEHTPEISILIGDPLDPQIYDTFTMMKFLSQKGKLARSTFEEIPFYFAEYAW